MNKIYLAVLYDRHVDDTYAVFSTPEKAVEQCHEWENDSDYSRYTFEEKTVDGWLYFATAGDDCPKTHVEEVEFAE